ncbi:unnamed protein product [Protopolystoma xenopodis]|uniref:Uncharacterized protein n=1 Tax=Protopolystoma xenopodis TaxID=117903 RepID=A0A3S5AN83_9PLAT|nr:unnamed protein product [Protopolystoma xenopodis]
MTSPPVDSPLNSTVSSMDDQLDVAEPIAEVIINGPGKESGSAVAEVTATRPTSLTKGTYLMEA